MIRIMQGDCRASLASLPSDAVHCVVTSPPYFGLRSYLSNDSAEKTQEIGYKQSISEYVESMVDVGRSIRQVLRPEGVWFLNIGDSYNGSGGAGGDYNAGGIKEGQPRYSGNRVNSLKPKDLCGVPWRVAFALQEDGWWLRSDIIWSKTSTMPESVTDRPTRSHEYVFLLTRSQSYFWDQDAVREPPVKPLQVWEGDEFRRKREAIGPMARGDNGFNHQWQRDGRLWGTESGHNIRDVWTIGPEPANFDFCESCGRFYCGSARSLISTGPNGEKKCPQCGRDDSWCDHYAMMPPSLVERCVKAGTSERGCCPTCGSPWKRVVERTAMVVDPGPKRIAKQAENPTLRTAVGGTMVSPPTSTTIGWKSSCSCDVSDPVPCTVLDPFSGAGTTAMVASRLGRSAIGCELSPRYVALSKARIEADQPLLNRVEVVV